MDEHNSKFVIICIFFIEAVLALIIIDNFYITSSLAQSNESDIGTKRIIMITNKSATDGNITTPINRTLN